MAQFERSLLYMIKSIKFKTSRCHFQNQLNRDIHDNITSSNSLIVPADKTSNFYKMDIPNYNSLLQSSITSKYKKLPPSTLPNIEAESKTIATQLNLDDRINTVAPAEAYVTLKDHKTNFTNNPTCRLINPAKTELGKISKVILEGINSKVNAQLQLNQWRNTSMVLQWFNNIDNKAQHTFITFDVVDFYPSISTDLLCAALEFAHQYTTVTDEDKRIILHTKQSYLFKAGEPWGKSPANLFDITMGSYDGAESCELVGLYLLNTISNKYGNCFGLYRDDGIGVVRETPRRAECIKKDLCAIFRHHGLKITIETNKKVVNFLDVTLDLTKGTYRPYTKDNSQPAYVHRLSNHPPQILKNIPASINKRLSEISSDQEMFNKAAPTYQTALRQSGYTYQLKFEPTPLNRDTRRRTRYRDVTWYNPPYSMNVATQIGKEFLKIINKEFPKSHILSKLFNRNTLKLSYSCMPSIQHKINSHNKAILSNQETTPASRTCNCRQPNNCPMSGNCLSQNIIYQATVEREDNRPAETYIGLTASTFKTRYSNHTASFNHANKRTSTELSKYIWELKSSNIQYNIKWRTVLHASPYSNTTKRCNLCLWEKFFIIYHPTMATLNSRNELVSACRHSNKFLLKNFKPP